jgi:hypothetical protein
MTSDAVIKINQLFDKFKNAGYQVIYEPEICFGEKSNFEIILSALSIHIGQAANFLSFFEKETLREMNIYRLQSRSPTPENILLITDLFVDLKLGMFLKEHPRLLELPVKPE